MNVLQLVHPDWEGKTYNLTNINITIFPHTYIYITWSGYFGVLKVPSVPTTGFLSHGFFATAVVQRTMSAD
jgi:hypothetical protein